MVHDFLDFDFETSSPATISPDNCTNDLHRSQSFAVVVATEHDHPECGAFERLRAIIEAWLDHSGETLAIVRNESGSLLHSLS